MTGADLHKIIERIQTAEQLTLTDVAEQCGASRTRLSVIMGKDMREQEVPLPTLRKLIRRWPVYFKEAAEDAARQMVQIPADSGAGLVQLQAIVSAFLQHYSQHLSSLGIATADQVREQVMDEAMRSLAARVKS